MYEDVVWRVPNCECGLTAGCEKCGPPTMWRLEMEDTLVALTEIPMTKIKLASFGPQIWAVDEFGRILHTEPVCTVNYEAHEWFFDWLESLEPPIEMPALPE